MDNTIHIQVKVVKLRNLVFFHKLAEARISLADVPKELRDPHFSKYVRLFQQN